MPKTVHKKPLLEIRTRQRFDAQVTFQMTAKEKAAIRAQIDGRRFRVQGDVLREMMYEYFDNHNIDPNQFNGVTEL